MSDYWLMTVTLFIFADLIYSRGINKTGKNGRLSKENINTINLKDIVCSFLWNEST